MKLLWGLFLVGIFQTAYAEDLKWSGATAFRYAERSFTDGIADLDVNGEDRSREKNSRHNIKLRIGVTGSKEKYDWMVGLRTQKSGNASTGSSEWIEYNSNGTDLIIGIDQAFVRYSASLDYAEFSAALGRQRGVFLGETIVQNLFSNDLRFDGLGLQLKGTGLGLNLGQYLLGGASSGAVSTSSVTNAEGINNNRMNWLTGLQPTAQFVLGSEISAQVALGYYHFQTEGYSNTAHGVIGSVGTPLPTSQGFSIDIDNARILQALMRWELPYNLQLSGEWLRNKKVTYPQSSSFLLDRNAFQVGLIYGKLKKARDFTIGYNYLDKGLGAVYSTFANSTIPADQKGHHLHAGYSITDFFQLGMKYLSIKESSSKQNDGSRMGSAAGASAYGSYLARSRYWELTASLTF